MNKKGLSNIVITLIIVLLSLVAMGILWAVISNILKTSQDVNTGQLTVSLDITNAYEQAGNIVVDVKRNIGKGELSGIKFVFSDESNPDEVSTQNVNFTELESRRFHIDLTQLIATQVKKVSIFPVLRSQQGSESIGKISDTYFIRVSEQDSGSCSPDCTGLQCGPDAVCGISCGTCAEIDSCISGICVPENCVVESEQQTCEVSLCGEKINNCGQKVICGTCQAGEVCISGSCSSIVPLNSGKVEETWPGTSGIYFGSSGFPIIENYQGRYIIFPGSQETGCLLISIYRFPAEGYAKSHVGFSFGTSIAVNDNYLIFENLEECQNY